MAEKDYPMRFLREKIGVKIYELIRDLAEDEVDIKLVVNKLPMFGGQLNGLHSGTFIVPAPPLVDFARAVTASGEYKRHPALATIISFLGNAMDVEKNTENSKSIFKKGDYEARRDYGFKISAIAAECGFSEADVGREVDKPGIVTNLKKNSTGGINVFENKLIADMLRVSPEHLLPYSK